MENGFLFFGKKVFGKGMMAGIPERKTKNQLSSELAQISLVFSLT
jgi:hypothetical protein